MTFLDSHTKSNIFTYFSNVYTVLIESDSPKSAMATYDNYNLGVNKMFTVRDNRSQNKNHN